MTWLVIKNKGVFINLEDVHFMEWNPEEGIIILHDVGIIWVPKEKTVAWGYTIAHEMGKGSWWKRLRERLFGPKVIEMEALRWESFAEGVLKRKGERSDEK